MSAQKLIKLFLGLSVGGLCLFLLLRHENWHQVGHAFASVRGGWLLAGVVVFLASLAARAERWHLILRPNARTGHVPRALGYEVFFLGLGANAVLPFRTGDILRGTVFCKYLGVPPIRAITAVFLEKLFDLVVICSMGFVMFYFFPIKDAPLVRLGTAGFGALVGLLCAILFGARFLRHPIAYVLCGLRRCFPILDRPIGFFDAQMHHVCDALDLVCARHMLIALSGWSIATWASEAVACYCVALAIPAISAPLASWCAMPLAVLSTALPGAPGGVGTFDFFAARGMTLWGNPTAAATAYAFILHMIILAVPVSLAVGAWMLNRALVNEGCRP